MSFHQPLPAPSPEPPKTLYDFDLTKWETMAENGGSESQVHVIDEELSGDPNLDLEAEYLEDESPYPEVRSAVANTDDPGMPAGTLRAWILGLIWAVVIPGVNQFYFFRYPSVAIGPLVAQLLSFPVGRLMARVLPQVRIFGASLNPGPFSIKEHVVVTIMAGVGATSAYATDIIAVQRFYYNKRYNFGYQFIIVMSTQLIGFSIGGIAKRFLVSPPSMIWPSNLVYCALFNTLHAQWYIGVGKTGGISRERFFVYAFAAALLWYFFPGYLFTALSYFSWVCWIKPRNATINSLFGHQSGLGMSLITFDWTQIAYIGSPLATPWWAEANVAFGFVVFFWVITPILYFTNVWNSQFMPVLSRHSFNNKGTLYNVTMVLTDEQFDEEKYKAYSPLFLPAGFAISYALSFASVTATIVHVVLYYRKQIIVQARRSLAEQPDIHARLMSHYKQVPDWWYLCIFVAMFAFGIIGIELYSTQMPVWAFVLALIIAFVYTLPIGIIQAVTNQQVGLNVITELVIGYLLPGRPLAMMLFKTWGYITMSQALTFTSDMKLGHYMKIPPRTMFWCQVVATVIAGLVQLAVQTWMFDNIPDMCSADQKDRFVCASTEVFYTATVIWGVVGPNRLFSAGQVYGFLRWFFLFGLSPVIPWYISKRYPGSWFRYVNIPVIVSGTGWIPPASALNYVPWAIVGFFSQYLVRRRHFGWWSKYNYVLSAALDAGTAIGAILVFFCLQYPSNGHIGEDSILGWWGNTVWMNTADYNMTAGKTLLTGSDYFGPGTW
ncbi:small oligopeptide transporter [Cytidiella melzeri]|nr:small oligopeptide transporter [Cytidiella melzeri]